MKPEIERNHDETSGKHSLKAWHTPSLKKLPIAATSNGTFEGNEGAGGGKGNAGDGLSS